MLPAAAKAAAATKAAAAGKTAAATKAATAGRAAAAEKAALRTLLKRTQFLQRALQGLHLATVLGEVARPEGVLGRVELLVCLRD